MKNRLGCVSIAGIVLAAVMLAAIAAWTVAFGQGLFSPGQLSAVSRGKTYGGISAHAQLAHDCGACHTAAWSSQTMTERCLACHTEVASQIGAKTGLHGPLVGTLSSPTCRGCHTDHHGLSASLTVLDPGTFPHDLTGYSLRGHNHTSRGTQFTCADCHGSDLAHFDQATCAICHEGLDATFMRRHEAAFGRTCLLCHRGNARDGANFDHNRLAFKLVGKHAQVQCEGCHSTSSPARLPQNTPQDCYACHAKNDKHAGKFGQQCGQCHTPNGWGNATFDHTIFPVDHGSRGQASSCDTCHPTGLTTYTCFGCHEHTPAGIQARHEGRPLSSLTDCVRCHAGGRGEGGG
jgi:hypothetical protein